MAIEGELIYLTLAIAAAGAFAGLLAGLFGIGGGIVIVPALYAAFGYFSVEETIRMHLAVGTSLATIILTSLRSAAAHAKRGAVDFAVLRNWSPYIALGAVAGAVLARFAPSTLLTLIFACGSALVSIRMFTAKEAEIGAGRSLPMKGAAPAGLGGAIGFISALQGIGGGVYGVMVMRFFGRPIHQAVATAAGFGFAIAVPGAIGFALAGLGREGLPAGSIGFVNLLGFVIISAMTLLVAPWGAALAHKLSKTLLTRIFASYLGLTALALFADTLG